MAVVLILFLLLAGMTSQVQNMWMRENSALNSRQKARVALELMARDLQGTVLPVNSYDPPGLQFLINPPGIGESYRCAHTAFWQTTCATDRDHGEIAEIGYFVRWDTGGTPPAPVLCRFLVNPGNPVDYQIYTNPQNWITDSLIEKIAPGTRSQKYRGLLVDDILGLWIQCYDSVPDAVPRTTYDSRVTGKLPASMEISLILLQAPWSDRLTVDDQKTIQTLYSTTETAEDFTAALPQSLRPGAVTYRTRVCLDSLK